MKSAFEGSPVLRPGRGGPAEATLLAGGGSGAIYSAWK